MTIVEALKKAGQAVVTTAVAAGQAVVGGSVIASAAENEAVQTFKDSNADVTIAKANLDKGQAALERAVKDKQLSLESTKRVAKAKKALAMAEIELKTALAINVDEAKKVLDDLTKVSAEASALIVLKDSLEAAEKAAKDAKEEKSKAHKETLRLAAVASEAYNAELKRAADAKS
jgi:hypothetical protein